MKTLFEDALESGAKLIGRAVNVAGADYLVVETEGLARVDPNGKQKDVAMFLPAKDADLRLQDCARLLNTIATMAAKGEHVDVGGRTVMKGATLFGEYPGVAYGPPHSLPESRIGGERVIAVPLLAEELSLVERCGAPRVLASLGNALRFFPYPPWPVRGRPPALRAVDVQGSTFAHGMPAAGAFAAAIDKQVVILRPHADASRMILDQLRAGRPVVCATPVDDAWCAAALVYAGEGKPAHAITRDGAAAGPVGASFVAITVAPSHRGGVGLEDGVGVALGPHDARRLCGALATGTPFSLDDPDALPDGARRMKVRVEPQGGAVTSERPQTEHVFLVALELLSDAAKLDGSVDIGALSAFHDDVVRMVDAAVKKHAPKAGSELRLRHQLEQGRAQPRVSVLQTAALPKALVDDIGDAVCAAKAPAVKDAPVAFELVFVTL